MLALTRNPDRVYFYFRQVGIRGDPEFDIGPAIVVSQGQADEFLGKHICIGYYVASPVPSLDDGIDWRDVFDGPVVIVDIDRIANAQVARKGNDDTGNQVLDEGTGRYAKHNTERSDEER